jgi:hypothetical protein
MRIKNRKTYRTPITLRNEIDLLHFPFGGIIVRGWPFHYHTPAVVNKISVKEKQLGRNRTIKYSRDIKNLDFYYIHPNFL